MWGKATRDGRDRLRAAGRRGAPLGALLVVAVVGLGLVALAVASPMRSTKLGPRLCETTGGGKFVRIPGFPGEMIDRRLLTDIKWIEERYPIYITDGYSMDDVHAENGEHPIGLALDIVPNKAEGGRWPDITALAHWAEPRQNRPRLPFRWVGYNGDAGHGRGNHLHLSWSHSVTRPGRAAKTVETIRCPVPGTTPPPPSEPPTTPPPDEPPAPPPPPPTGGATSSGAHRGNDRDHDGRRGGRDRNHDGRAGQGDRHGGRGGRGGDGARGHAGGIGRGSRGLPASGGVKSAKLSLAPVVVETDGVGLNDD
jgi:hypothetical protein